MKPPTHPSRDFSEEPPRPDDIILRYTDRNTQVKNLKVKFLRRVGVGRLLEVEVLEMWSSRLPAAPRDVIKEFHPGQRIMVDECRTEVASAAVSHGPESL